MSAIGLFPTPDKGASPLSPAFEDALILPVPAVVTAQRRRCSASSRPLRSQLKRPARLAATADGSGGAARMAEIEAAIAAGVRAGRGPAASDSRRSGW